MYLHLLYALFVGVSVACLWSFILNSHGPWKNVYWFFLVVFLFSWGGGLWITPFGPTGYGVSWLPFVMMGLVAALLLSAATPRLERRKTPSRLVHHAAPVDTGSGHIETSVEFMVDLVFWCLVVVLLTSIFARYTWFSDRV